MSAIIVVIAGHAASAAAQGHHEPLFHYSRAELGYSLGGGEAGTWDVDGSGWVGSDLNRLWWRAGSELTDGRHRQTEIGIFYGRYVRTFWDVVIGYRREIGVTDADAVMVGVTGLAPYWFEISALAFVRSGLNPGIQLSVETDLLLTQRLIVRPDLRLDMSASSDTRMGVRSGLETFEAGLRTRYEFSRKFAPYFDVRLIRERGGDEGPANASASRLRFGGGLQLIF